MSTNKKTECVKVAVRCRPMSENEKKEKYEISVNVVKDRGEINI